MQQSQISKLECLQSFLDDFKEADSLPRLEQRNIEWILRALEFEGMNTRREQVGCNVGDTFEWIIADDAVPKGHPDLRISFKNWLDYGKGVYHITGKPGSGKSTLMKLIDQAEAAEKQLENWASRAGNRLIIARFYTWKAATAHPLQNQEEGLTRTLLHQVLTAAPELTPVIFEKHSCWAPQKYRLINLLSLRQGIRTSIHFEPREVLAALESVLRTQGYSFFLLIDGMDEFEKAHDHHAIAKRVLGWSSNNLDRVKICVSSREDNAFMDRFSADQRLRLHIVTQNDVRELVATRLMEHDVFAEGSSENRQRIIESIVSRAEGVFLWVVLTIQELKLLLDDRQSFQTLLQAVHELPKEMEDFFRETLRRIPARYKKESEAIFSVVTSIFGKSEYFSLFHYSMLQKCIDKDGPNTDTSPRPMSLDEAVSQIREFRSRLPSLSKGLLETTPGCDYYGISYKHMNREDKNDTIQCNHRSVFDFLRSSMREPSAAVDFDFPVQARGEILAIRSAIEVIRAIPWDGYVARNYERYLVEIFRQIKFDKFLHNREGNFTAPLLRTLDATLLRKQEVIEATTPFGSTALGDIWFQKEAVSVFIIAFFIDFCEYLDWASKNYPPWILAAEAKSWVAGAYFSWKSRQAATGKVPVRCLTESGWLSINEPLLANRIVPASFFPVQRGSIWVNNLIYLMLNDHVLRYRSYMDPSFEQAISAGAECRIRFKWFSQGYFPNSSRLSTRKTDSVQMKPSSPDEMTSDRHWAPYHRDMPSGPQYGIKIEVGDAHALEWIQGPQEGGEEYIRLIRFCVERFGKPSGSATFEDLMTVLSTIIHGVDGLGHLSQYSRNNLWSRRRQFLKAVDDAHASDSMLSTSNTQSDSPAMGDTTEDGQQHLDIGETSTSDEKGARNALGPPDNPPSRLSWLVPRMDFHYWQAVLISSLGKSRPYHRLLLASGEDTD